MGGCQRKFIHGLLVEDGKGLRAVCTVLVIWSCGSSGGVVGVFSTADRLQSGNADGGDGSGAVFSRQTVAWPSPTGALSLGLPY